MLVNFRPTSLQFKSYDKCLSAYLLFVNVYISTFTVKALQALMLQQNCVRDVPVAADFSVRVCELVKVVDIICWNYIEISKKT